MGAGGVHPLVEEAEIVFRAEIEVIGAVHVIDVRIAGPPPLLEALQVIGRDGIGVHLGREGARRIGGFRPADPEIIEGTRKLQAVGNHMVLPLDRPFVEREGTAVADGQLVAGRILGRNQDHAVRGPGAVDGGRRGILEDGNVLDVLGVHGRKFALDPVDQHQRTAALADGILRHVLGAQVLLHHVAGRAAPDVDGASVRRLAVRLENTQAGHLALERTGHVGIGTAFQVLA